MAIGSAFLQVADRAGIDDTTKSIEFASDTEGQAEVRGDKKGVIDALCVCWG